MEIILLIYWAAGYWATGQTIFANRILIGSMKAIFLEKCFWGLFLGWLLIPWAIIKKLTSK